MSSRSLGWNLWAAQALAGPVKIADFIGNFETILSNTKCLDTES
jgi:hypothetical protein